MNLKNKKVLVTGSDGFVGKHLVLKLKIIGAKVFTFDISDKKDITKWEDFKNFSDIDIVYHLAAITFVPFSQENPRMTYRVNIQGTTNVLEFCRLNNSKIIFASSYVYGRPKYLPIDEKHPTSPTNPYARSKIIGEILCKAYNKDYGVKCVIIRSFNLYGEGQNNIFLIPQIINQLKLKKNITIRDLRPKRDFLYIKDAVEAYLKAGEFYKSSFEIFNIGYGKSYSVEEIVEKLIKLSHRDNLKIKSLNKIRKGEIPDTIADIRKSKKLLKWRPLVDIDEGLNSTFINSN